MEALNIPLDKLMMTVVSSVRAEVEVGLKKMTLPTPSGSEDNAGQSSIFTTLDLRYAPGTRERHQASTTFVLHLQPTAKRRLCVRSQCS